MKNQTNDRLFCKNFILLLLGQISSLVGNYSLKFALSMYILDLTGSASVFSIVTAAAMLPMILLSPFGGVLADRADRRRVMVLLDTLSGCILLGCGLMLTLGRGIIYEAGGELYIVGGLLVIMSIIGAFESPTVQACVPQILSGDNVIRGNAAVSQVSAIAALVTPFIGSLIYTAFGINFVLFGTTVCFLLTAGFELFIHLEPVNTKSSSGVLTTISHDLREGMNFLRRDRPELLLLLLVAASVSLFLAGIAVVGFPYIVRTVLGLSTEHYAISESASALAAIAGGIFVGVMANRLRAPHLTYTIVGFGALLLPLAVVFLLPTDTAVRFSFITVIFCLCQFGCSIFSTLSITLIQAKTPDHLMGKIMSYVYTLSLCAQPVGQLLFGWLLDRYSSELPAIFLGCGLVIGLIGVLTARYIRRIDRDDCK